MATFNYYTVKSYSEENGLRLEETIDQNFAEVEESLAQALYDLAEATVMRKAVQKRFGDDCHATASDSKTYEVETPDFGTFQVSTPDFVQSEARDAVSSYARDFLRSHLLFNEKGEVLNGKESDLDFDDFLDKI